MAKFFWQSLLVVPAAFGAALALSTTAEARSVSRDLAPGDDARVATVSVETTPAETASVEIVPIETAPVESATIKAIAIEAVLIATVPVDAAEVASNDSVPSVIALEQQPVQLAQITSVSELSDVQPTDWAYQALQSLVEQYGCI